jgi:predicted transglutaminase-like cysteine proteinase
LPEPYRSVFRAGLFTGLVAIWVPLVTVVFAASAELGFSRSVTPGLIARLERQFGRGASKRLEGWKAYVRDTARPEATARPAGDDGLLRSVNRFFNRVQSVTDLAHWGVEDYWATPSETLASNGADCEDYAIAKYFTLKELGVPISRLRLVYAKTWHSRNAHLVLAYYPEPRADPLILDNLEGNIRPASDRPDLIPVYTFNDEDLLWPQAGAPTVRLSATSNRKWKDVLEKLERELTY